MRFKNIPSERIQKIADSIKKGDTDIEAMEYCKKEFSDTYSGTKLQLLSVCITVFIMEIQTGVIEVDENTKIKSVDFRFLKKIWNTCQDRSKNTWLEYSLNL